MKTFLVGGAVRDFLLNIPMTEKDWLVVGQTPESMIKQGFQAVGKDFPVFLHPQTHEEYALARTERKTDAGYKGFTVYTSPQVTLEQDLIRRDLTINAIAQDEKGHFIDPYNGRKDLENRILRHVSAAFSEDPVRILRIARFAARYAHLGFTIAKETMQLMQDMVKQGETNYLVAERVWAELHKALAEKTPAAFFYTLKECHALATIFPEIHQLFGVPQPAKYHPEIDTGVHSLLCLEQVTKLSSSPEVRLATLLHDLGKAATDKNKWPSHHGHEALGIPILQRFCTRLRVPKKFKALAYQVMRYHTHCHRVFELRAATLTDMLSAFKSADDVASFALACEADARGRTGLENEAYPQSAYLLKVADVIRTVDTSKALTGGLQGAEIAVAIRQLRIDAVADFMQATSKH